uniref:DUF19 domain-containing protein n=1 Tax=Panagrolaimus sp. PS1159 TaxID=55785 RepID=A0AC35GWU1_9BILA
MREAVFVFLFITALIPLKIDGLQCETRKAEIKKCYFNFLEIYDFSFMPPFDNFSNSINEIEINQGWTGEVYICNNAMTLVNCINKISAELTPECFSTIFDFSGDDSIGYVTYFYLAQYRCQGKGFTEFEDTYNCSKTMKNCPGKADSCFAIKSFLECMKKQALNKCGDEYSDFLSNSLQILINVTYNSCLRKNNNFIFSLNKRTL